MGKYTCRFISILSRTAAELLQKGFRRFIMKWKQLLVFHLWLSGLQMLKEAKSSIPHSDINPVFERLGNPSFTADYGKAQLAEREAPLFFQDSFPV